MANQHTILSKCNVRAKSQPHFTLLASDNFTSVILGEWIDMAVAKGVSATKINQAQRVLENIEEWRRKNPTECKTPD